MPKLYSKSMATIEATGDDEAKYGPNGGFTAVLSTPSLDRDGDRLQRNEWIEPLPERLPLDSDHGMTVADTVGSFHPYFDEDGRLMMDAAFASTPKAQEVRTLIQEGHISTVSVAFMNDKAAQKDGKPHRELLNAGVVAIPSNRDAVILASKAYEAIATVQKQVEDGVITAEDFKDFGEQYTDEEEEDGEDDRTVGEVIAGLFNFDGTKALAPAPAVGNENALLQAIHDASVHLGAQCAACTEVHAADMPAAPAAKPEKSVTFRTEDHQALGFDSKEAAHEFFTSMLKSLDEADENGEELVEVVATSVKDFDQALDEAINTPTAEVESSQESPADPPEVAAASVEEPAPASAEEAAETDVASSKGRHLELLLFAAES